MQVRDSLLEQLTTLQNRLESKERDLTTSHQKVEALSESLATAQYSLRFNNDELAEKRKILSDAIKEKSRFRDLARKLELTIEAPPPHCYHYYFLSTISIPCHNADFLTVRRLKTTNLLCVGSKQKL
jgi:hypothetical protein